TRASDAGCKDVAEPADVENVVGDDAAEERAEDAEERGLEQADVLAPRHDQPAEAAHHEPDDPVPDERPEHAERKSEQTETDGHQKDDQDQRDEGCAHTLDISRPRRRIAWRPCPAARRQRSTPRSTTRPRGRSATCRSTCARSTSTACTRTWASSCRSSPRRCLREA